MQKALLVRDDVNLLNQYLENDWKVINICAAPSSVTENGHSVYPTCLVIIEKSE